MSTSEVFCSSCGARNESDATFCSDCGARLATAPPPPPPASGVPAAPATPARQEAGKGSPLPLLLAIGAIIVLLVVVLVEGVIILLPRGTTTEGGATLSVLQGQVYLQKGGRGEWIEVLEDFAVGAGDRIRTADASHAVLTFMEDTTTELRALTELTVEELQVATDQRVVIRVDLELGEIWNRIAELPADSVHEITTVAAKVTCHGSEYGVAVNEAGTTWVTGQGGRVEVTGNGQTVPLASGDTVVVELGSAPVSYREVAALPTPPAAEVTGPVSTTLESVDMPTFLNQPVAAGTPTNTPTATPTTRPAPPTSAPTPTHTRTPRPTATVPCPTIHIREPSRAPARGPFGIEFNRTGAKPGGYDWAVRYRPVGGSWIHLPVPATVVKRGDYWMAEVRSPGEGSYQWQVCIARRSDPTGPFYCCSNWKTIEHATDDTCPDCH